MVFSLLKKLFGDGDANPSKGGDGAAPAAAPVVAAPTERPKSVAPARAAVADASQPDVEAFVLYAVQALVDHPDQASVTAEKSDRALTLQVRCAKGDAGKIIGKSGKTIAAIRTLANGAAGRAGPKIQVEILD
jgi:hypothetical protein